MSNVVLDETIQEQTDPYNEMSMKDQELIQDYRQRPGEYKRRKACFSETLIF